MIQNYVDTVNTRAFFLDTNDIKVVASLFDKTVVLFEGLEATDGEVINGGFGLLLDGTPEAKARLKSMLFYDVNNGIARRSWARNKEALFAIKREMKRTPNLKVTIPNLVEDDIINDLF